MSKGIFLTGTGTDVGKTYVSALLIKAMLGTGHNCGYYKAAASGAGSIADSDGGCVSRAAGIAQEEDSLQSYLYKTPVSPHLAARMEGNPLTLEKVAADYEKVCCQYDYVVTEGSGGIICPLRWDDEACILLEDIVKMLSLPALVIALSGLGTINATALTVHYLKTRQIPVFGVVMNRYTGDEMQADNVGMIEAITGVPVIAKVRDGAAALDIPIAGLQKLFGAGE